MPLFLGLIIGVGLESVYSVFNLLNYHHMVGWIQGHLIKYTYI